MRLLRFLESPSRAENLIGSSYAEGVGGGIRNLEHLTLSDSVVSGNAAMGDFGFGGGVSDYYFGGPSGTTEIVRSRISGNTARFGGGAYVGASTTIRESTIQNNIASVRRGRRVQELRHTQHHR